MRHEIQKFLYDVQRACELIGQFIQGKSLDDYRADALLRSGVERQLGIIGEALHQAVRIDQGLEDFITDIWQIVRFRHILIHAYSIVRDETVWGILQKDLSVLSQEVRALLGQAPNAAGEQSQGR
jgi:uncharacterized protein with HEPN domain